MIHKIFTVYDSKALAYLAPVFMPTRGAAIRAFGDTCADPNSLFAKHPADYTFFEIGEFDDSTCTMEIHDALINLGTALDFVSKPENPSLRSVQ